MVLNEQMQFLNLASMALEFQYEFKMVNFLKLPSWSLYHFERLGVDIILYPTKYSTAGNKLAPINVISYDIFTRMTEPHVSNTYFLSTFSLNLWISVFLIISLSILVLIAHHKVYKLSGSVMINTIMMTFGMIPSSDALNLPCKVSLNLTKIVISILCFVIGISMSAFLVAELTTTESKYPFKDLNDFWQQSHYGICSFPQDLAFKFLLNLDPNQHLLNNKNCDHYNINSFAHEKICNTRALTAYLGSKELIEWNIKAKGANR